MYTYIYIHMYSLDAAFLLEGWVVNRCVYVNMYIVYIYMYI